MLRVRLISRIFWTQLHPSWEIRRRETVLVSICFLILSLVPLCCNYLFTKYFLVSGISKIFSLFDDDKSGSITLKNLKRVAKELGETMSEEELREMIERADSMGNGGKFKNILFDATLNLSLNYSLPQIPMLSFYHLRNYRGRLLHYYDEEDVSVSCVIIV